MRFDLREGFFLDRGHHHFVSLSSRRVEDEKRKLAVAGDETKFFFLNRHEVRFDLEGRRASLALWIKRAAKGAEAAQMNII